MREQTMNEIEQAMPDSGTIQHRALIKSPRGAAITCKGWQQEGALRMLMNNLDPDVAERPEDLVVYGGTGKAARNWESFEAIVTTLRRLESDETLLVRVGNPSQFSAPMPARRGS